VTKLIVAMLVVAGVAGAYLLLKDDHGKRTAPAVKTAGVVHHRPGIVDESYRQFTPFHSTTPPTVEAIAEGEHPLQIPLGGSTEIKFAVKEINPAAPHTPHHLKAYMLHNRDAPVELPLKEAAADSKEKNKVTVAFTPPTNGQFNVVLTENDNPVGSKKVGVIGSAAAATNLNDPNALDAADPIVYGNRSWNHGLHRR
jgi:hypothetical protein